MAVSKKKKSVKRRKDHPTVIGKKSASTGAWYAFRARIEPILARTAAARAELDAKMRGADMRSLAHLPVMFPPTIPKPPGLQRLMRTSPREPRPVHNPHDHPPKPPIAPPVPFDKNELYAEAGRTKLKKATADRVAA